jgi:membrane protein implicated in regulation of membrane protease activity
MMKRQAAVVVYVLAMIAAIVSVDILFFGHEFWERLIVNVGIVVIFVSFYFRFLKRSEAQPPRSG